MHDTWDGRAVFCGIPKPFDLEKSCLRVLNIDALKKRIQDWINSRGLSILNLQKIPKRRGHEEVPSFQVSTRVYAEFLLLSSTCQHMLKAKRALQHLLRRRA